MASRSRSQMLEIEELRLDGDQLIEMRGNGRIGEDLDAFVEKEDFVLVNEIGTGPTKVRVFQNKQEFLCVLETPVKLTAFFCEDPLTLGNALVGLNFLTNRTIGIKAAR